ncbi:MAG: hypothetical protein K9L56_15220 [Clostridiales bacterium]|nr:hypothetical protein [Clostridiales bacterium]
MSHISVEIYFQTKQTRKDNSGIVTYHVDVVENNKEYTSYTSNLIYTDSNKSFEKINIDPINLSYIALIDIIEELIMNLGRQSIRYTDISILRVYTFNRKFLHNYSDFLYEDKFNRNAYTYKLSIKNIKNTKMVYKMDTSKGVRKDATHKALEKELKDTNYRISSVVEPLKEIDHINLEDYEDKSVSNINGTIDNIYIDKKNLVNEISNLLLNGNGILNTKLPDGSITPIKVDKGDE